MTKQASPYGTMSNGLPVIPPAYTPWILAALLVVAVSLIYFPVAFQHKAPIASDITQWQGAAKAIIDYNKENSDNALWTPYMFSGMPSYMISFPNRYPFLESITKITDFVINWRIFLLIIGGLGIFVLLRHLKMDPWIAFMGAIAFIFSCHWVGLIEVGHNTKFRAIMYIPWVIWAMFRLRDKRDVLSLGLMATFLITQLRENHPQISYYLYLFIGMYWIFNLIESLKAKEGKRFGIFTILLIAAFGLTVLAVMNPYMSTMEYSHYTMRGGEAGLEKSYAQNWSFHPLEILGFVIPDFFGGINENYWGYMPFTQIYNYFGLVVLALGFLALAGKHKRMAIFLWIASAIFTVMSFGEFAPFISDLLLKYLPYFNKFRVPSMILTMTQIIGVILAALGADTIVSYAEEKDNKRFTSLLYRVFWICGIVFVAWLVLAKPMFKGLPFVNAGTLEQLKQQGLTELPNEYKMQRLDLLYKSGIISLLLLTISMGLAYLHMIKKLKKTALLVFLTGIIFIDLWIYTGKHLRNLESRDGHDRRFEMTNYDDFLLQDKTNYRIFPFNTTRIRPAGEWAYFHQTIDGYSAAKLKRYDDILKLIYGDPKTGRSGEFYRYLTGIFDEGGIEKSMPILDMLSTKYIILPDSLPMAQYFQRINPVFAGEQNMHIYKNNFALPRAWFVKEQRLLANADSVYAALSRGNFDPARTALLESKDAIVAGADSLANGSVAQTAWGMQSSSYQLRANGDGFLVLSEVYYPAGWKALLDGKEIPIYPVNYILRGVKIPAGEHNLEMVFAPESYKKSLVASLAGILITILIVAGGFAMVKLKNTAPAALPEDNK